MGRLSPFLLSRPGPLCLGLARGPRSAVHLWSTGLAVYRRAHMLQYKLSARVLFPEARKRLVPAGSLMTVRELAAARQAAEDDLLSHRPVCLGSFREIAAQGRPTRTVRAKL
jgi:hypothetical protein